MLHQNHMARCLFCQKGITKNFQTRWRGKGTGAPAPDRCGQPTPEPTPTVPGTPHTPTGDISRAERSQIANLPAGYVYSLPYLPCAEFFTLDASAQDSQQDTDFDPDMLTDDRTSTG